MNLIHTLALPLIAVTYIGVAIGEYPHLRMNRATIALVGAVALVVLGVLPLDTALQSLDVSTLLLLFAMMIVNVHLRLAGFFDWISNAMVVRAHSPRFLLACIIGSGLLAALFLNDTIVLMFTPLVLQVTLALKRNPIPYLMGLATAANIGSTATIIGNPQNMLIGTASNIPFTVFLFALAPVALVGLAIAWGILVLVYREEFAAPRMDAALISAPAVDFGMLRKTIVITALMLVAFLLGAPIPLAALAAAALLLVTRRVDPDHVLSQVD